VSADELQAAIAASFETARQECNNAKTVEDVNHALLEVPMNISVDRRVYTLNLCQALLVRRHPPLTPAALLH
jgi:hypothetical protein